MSAKTKKVVSAKTKKVEDHGCIKKVNDLLATRNGQLVGTLNLSGRPQSILVAVEKKDDAERTKPGLLTANFCPFCGDELRGGS